MFKSNNNGFHMTFENGWTISVQWQYGNYCDNKSEAKAECPNAEIGIWDKDDNWYNFSEYDNYGWLTPLEVVEWMNKVSKW